MIASSTERVRELAEANVPLEHIESYIEGLAGLDDEDRAVLWLSAWCYTGGFGGLSELARDLGCPDLCLSVDCQV